MLERFPLKQDSQQVHSMYVPPSITERCFAASPGRGSMSVEGSQFTASSISPLLNMVHISFYRHVRCLFQAFLPALGIGR